MINLFYIVHDFSGVRTYTNELTGYLASQDDVYVYKVFLYDLNHNEFTTQKENNITSVYIPVKITNDYNKKYYKRAAQLIYSHYSNLQCIMIHINMHEQFYFAEELKNLFKCPLIFTCHFLNDFYSYYDKLENNKFDPTLTNDTLLKETLAAANKTICVTKFSKRILQNFYQVNASKLKVIYNGMKEAYNLKNTIETEKLKRHYGFCDKDRIILYAGQLETRKGIDKLINAFGLLKNKLPYIKLVIAGTGDFNTYMSFTNEFIGRIHFTGKLNSKILIDFYNFSEIGVIPSQFEQCSYVAIEMMHYGLPLVISDVPGLNELLIHGKTGMICKTKSQETIPNALEADEADLALQMEFLLQNPARAKKIARTAREYALKQYSTEKMGKQILNIYLNARLTKVKTMCDINEY